MPSFAQQAPGLAALAARWASQAGLGSTPITPVNLPPGMSAIADSAPKRRSLYGYAIRQPFASEDTYFKKNPQVAGMAAEDGRIVLNPYSKNKPEEQQIVARNEAIRLWMRENNVEPKFNLTQEQMKQFEGTEYGKPENALHAKHTILARIITGDKSAKDATPMQKKWADSILKKLPKD